ncbi:MAG: hypothetical protein A2925_03045 [Candidatus Yanofskybacteria bacterium RIFCSPLOWO2_01_FULL_44_22]|uniref:Uncharacterized protein n=2 Tax=Candidatus Yanofskyibacteriota TaxID=1752733 RepID=A0A1F8GIF7_9BACT|nr:MAG: hypothetical protein UW79_C0033G0010 [Candidatus Yanofskybacteria bacterium GW2011_GWA2_44_9]OGN25187.1 MAG: hypothetical protein A2925_03045 [Candidatus Yanofskybacteria bacterium RIFCSPLOWO2_01_FULL_44_22]
MVDLVDPSGLPPKTDKRTALSINNDGPLVDRTRFEPLSQLSQSSDCSVATPSHGITHQKLVIHHYDSQFSQKAKQFAFFRGIEPPHCPDSKGGLFLK